MARRCYYLLQVSALIVLLVSFFALYYTYEVSDEHATVVIGLKKEIKRMNSEIKCTREYETSLNNNFSVWQEISNTHAYLEDDGVNDARVRVIIEDLCKQHKLACKEIVFSDALDVSQDYGKSSITILRSIVRVKFSALTDKHAVLLMHDLKYDIPGFIAVRLLEISKEREITQEVKELYNSGVVPYMVDGRVVFDWYRISGRHL